MKTEDMLDKKLMLKSTMQSNLKGHNCIRRSIRQGLGEASCNVNFKISVGNEKTYSSYLSTMIGEYVSEKEETISRGEVEKYKFLAVRITITAAVLLYMSNCSTSCNRKVGTYVLEDSITPSNPNEPSPGRDEGKSSLGLPVVSNPKTTRKTFKEGN